MKKFFKYATLVCSIFILLLINNSSVSAASESFYSRAVRDGNGNVRFKWSLMGASGVNATKIMKWSNSDPVYCIEPGLTYLDFSEGSYNSTSDEAMSRLNSETIRRLKLLSYYGYGYGNHTDDSWYLATQLEIWNTISPGCCYITSGDSALIESERSEIRNLVNGVTTLPSFQNGTYTQVVGKAAEYTDSNNVIGNYSVSGCTNCSASISGNKLIVTPSKVGTAKIDLTRTVTNSYSPSVVFYNGNYQKLMEFGSPDPMITNLNINVVGGKIKITKLDSETDSKIPQGEASLVGAKYQVIDSNNNVVATLTIGSDNTAITDNLPTGDFKIKEIEAPKGYKLNEKVYNATISSGDTVNITVEDEVIKSKIKVIKKDSETNSCTPRGEASLIGAKYEIRNNRNEVVDTITIGDDCTATSKSLPYGNYTVKEIEAPVGYNIDTNGYTANISSNQTVEITSVEKVIEGRIKIVKKDSETNSCTPLGQATLVGAKFDILDADKKVVDTITIGDDCTAISKYLPYAHYTIVEKEAPKGYELNKGEFGQFISNNSDYTTEVKEKVIKNYISILKQYDYVDGNTTFLNAEANISFEIYYPDGTLYDTITTDKNGYASINIPYGVWKFHQVNSTTGFEKIYDFFVTVDENSEKEQYYNILNNKIAAYLQIYKKDSETNKTIELANTTFKIYNKDKKQYVSQYVGGKVYDTFKTDDKGVLTTYLKLEAGNYRIEEVKSPKNYLIDDSGVDFTIGEETEYYYTTYGAFVVVEFNNTPIKGQVEIFKSGETFVIEEGTFKYETEKLEGIKYNLYADEDIKSADGNYLYYNKGDLVETLITDSKGYSISKKLPLGKYFLVEVETKDGYILDTKEHHFELTEIDNKTAIVFEKYEALNKLIKGDLEFTKTDLVDGEPIPNTIIEIFTDKDELIYNGKTDKEGKISLKNIPLGKYYIIEKEAATGYLLSNEKVYFEIKENGEVVKAKMTNKKITSTLKIVKVDENNSPLEGVIFGVYDSEDKLIDKYTTDKEGKIEVVLEYGKYYFKELSTLEGYVLDCSKISFEVKEDNTIIEKTITNEEIIGKVEILKIDSITEEALEGAEFEIYNSITDELVFSGKTNEEGIIEVELKYGKYYIKEKTAPENYIISEEKIEFKILEDDVVVQVKINNEKIIEEVPDTLSKQPYRVYIISLAIALMGVCILLYGNQKKR